jgi:hypothetical protein
MEKRRSYSIEGGHITWTGKEDPTPLQLKILEKLARKVCTKVSNLKSNI